MMPLWEYAVIFVAVCLQGAAIVYLKGKNQ
jgi:hypothetical protein